MEGMLQMHSSSMGSKRGTTSEWRTSFPHVAIKLSTKSHWLRARNYIDKEHGIKVNFSDRHDNYYGAHRYVTKEDCEFIVSPNHPDFSNATGPPKTSNAILKRENPCVSQNLNENVCQHLTLSK